MDEKKKFLLPPPNFKKNLSDVSKPKPHFLTPSGMTELSREAQPPPMYGPRGATVPAKFLKNEKSNVPTERKFCESCDMEFHTERDYTRHNATHEPCPVDGCTFLGHPHVMDKHVMNFHSSGLFEIVKNVSTPEEIAAWREERRKKYPTTANVLQRQAIQAQKQKRGERLEPNKRRFAKNTQRADSAVPISIEEKPPNKNKRKKQRKSKPIRKVKKTNAEKPKCDTEEDENDDRLEFKGTMNMSDYVHFEESKNKLIQLLGVYASSDEDAEEEEHIEEKKKENTSEILKEEKQNLKVDKNKKEVYKKLPPRTENYLNNIKSSTNISSLKDVGKKDSDSDEGPDEMSIAHSEIEPFIIPKATTSTVQKVPSTKKVFKRKSGLDYSKLKKYRQNTMLEKLLEKEIRHERNVLLQCVRFVVNNEFFGIGS